MLNRLVRGFAPALVLAMLPVASFAGVSVGLSIDIAPPALPVYVQPAPPAPDYIWTPGYWAYGDDGYYWVPGTWVMAPEPGLLWTPGYWGWNNGLYVWNGGYWGPHVGFYGGVNYGFGYGGVGFEGGFWRGGHVIYNRSVTNVTNINVTNVYNKTVVVNNVNRVSFNGGHGGIEARPTRSQLAVAHERHFDPTPDQRQHIQMAAQNRDLRASVNGGRPHVAATERPGAFTGKGVVGARGPGGGSDSVRPGGPRTDRPPQAQHENSNHPAMRTDRPADRGGVDHAGAGRPADHAGADHAGADHAGAGRPAERAGVDHAGAARPADHAANFRPAQGSQPGGRPEPHNAPNAAGSNEARNVPHPSPHPMPQLAERRGPASAPSPGAREQARPSGGGRPEARGPQGREEHR